MSKAKITAAPKKSTAKKATAKTPVGAKATAAKATKAAPKAAAKPKVAKDAKAEAPKQIPATPQLQQLADERFEIVAELAVAKATVNTIDEKLKKKNAELIEGGAVVGMIFLNEDGDAMQFTHNVKASKAYAKVLKELVERKPELADLVGELEVKYTTESQQQPNFKAA